MPPIGLTIDNIPPGETELIVYFVPFRVLASRQDINRILFPAQAARPVQRPVIAALDAMADAHAPQGDVAVPSYAVHDGQTPVSTSAEPLANATAAPSTPRVVEGRDVSPSPSVKDAQRPFKPPLSPGERARVRAHRAALLGGFEPPSPPHRTPQERARDRTLNQYAQQSMTSLSKVRDHHLEENIWLLAAVEAVNDCRQRGELDALMSKGGDADVKPSLTAIVKQRLERKVGQLQVELAELGAPASASTSRPAKIREPAHRVLYDVVAKLQTDRANAIKKRDDCRKELAEFLRSAEQNRGLAPIVPDPTVADSKEHLNAPLAPGEQGGPNFAYLQIPPDLPRYPEMEKMLRDLRGYVDVVLKFYGETGEFPPPGIYQNPHYPGLNAPHIPEKIYPQRKGRPPAFSLGSSVGGVRALPRALQRLLHGRDLLDAFGRTPSQADERKSAAVKRAGRPPGSRNKRRRAQTDDDQQTDGGSDQGAAPRKRGRPPKLTTSSPLFRSIKLGAGLRDKQGRTVNTVVAQGIDMTEVPMWDSMDPSISTQIPYQLQYQARASSAAAAAAAAAEVDSQAVNQVVDAEATNRMVSDLIEQGFNADDAHAYGSQANVDALMGDEPLNLAQAGRMGESTRWQTCEVLPLTKSP